MTTTEDAIWAALDKIHDATHELRGAVKDAPLDEWHRMNDLANAIVKVVRCYMDPPEREFAMEFVQGAVHGMDPSLNLERREELARQAFEAAGIVPKGEGRGE